MEENVMSDTIIEKEVYCPYCEEYTAVIISETVSERHALGFPPLGCKDSILIGCTGGCWAIVNGFPLFDLKTEKENHLYGFCPCCGKSYPVLKPDGYISLQDKANGSIRKD